MKQKAAKAGQYLQPHWYLGFLGFIGFYKLPNVIDYFMSGGSALILFDLLWLLWLLYFLPQDNTKG